MCVCVCVYVCMCVCVCVCVCVYRAVKSVWECESYRIENKVIPANCIALEGDGLNVNTLEILSGEKYDVIINVQANKYSSC